MKAGAGRWGRWLLGGALLAGVIVAALRLSEGRDFVLLLEQAQPWWLAAAVVLQAATYLAQGEVWRLVARAGRQHVPVATTYKLSVAKLLVDQVLPSAGFSGTALFATALERRGMPRGVVMAGVVVNTVAYHAGYAASLAVALAILLARGRGSALILAASALFVVVAFLLALTVLVLSSRDSRAGTRALRRAPVVKTVLALLRQAEPRLTRRPWLHVRAAALQIAIGLLDAATIWVLIQSLGATAAPADVFASFAIATLFRTIGVVPGGLGTFEAASVVTLNLAGVAVPVALSATLLFRGFSFWLPMLPGLWLSRAVMRDVTAPERA